MLYIYIYIERERERYYVHFKIVLRCLTPNLPTKIMFTKRLLDSNFPGNPLWA